jgi:SOS-response transcriptional repressor LexA
MIMYGGGLQPFNSYIKRVPIVSGVNAGRSVPNDWSDWAISGFRDIRVTETGVFDRIIAVPVEGDSLKEHGILDGDYLICKVTSQYEPDKLGVWQTPHGRTAKFAYYDFDNSVVLHNEHGWQQRWDSRELRLLGIVLRVERDLE